MDYLIQIDKIKMELFTVYLYIYEITVHIFQMLMFNVPKDYFYLKNSSYADEMQHFAALHLGLRCLSKFSLRSQLVKQPSTAIHCSPRREGQTG